MCRFIKAIQQINPNLDTNDRLLHPFCIICRIDYKKQLIITETTAQTNVGCPTGLKGNTRPHFLLMVCGPRDWGRKSMKGEMQMARSWKMFNCTKGRMFKL